jgi:hypothetical protein
VAAIDPAAVATVHRLCRLVEIGPEEAAPIAPVEAEAARPIGRAVAAIDPVVVAPEHLLARRGAGTRWVTAAHRRDRVAAIAVEDSVVAAAETTREPAVTAVVAAWVAADIAAEVAAECVVEEEAAEAEVVAVEVAAVAEVAGDNKLDEDQTYEIKNEYYDFVENLLNSLRDR